METVENFFFQKFETFKSYLNLFLIYNENLKSSLERTVVKIETNGFHKKWELPNTGQNLLL